jgi:hypothetical protein
VEEAEVEEAAAVAEGRNILLPRMVEGVEVAVAVEEAEEEGEEVVGEPRRTSSCCYLLVASLVLHDDWFMVPTCRR